MQLRKNDLSKFSIDLGRMYGLVARVPDALGQLKQLLEDHIYTQGLNTIDKCGETALNVRNCVSFTQTTFYSNHEC